MQEKIRAELESTMRNAQDALNDFTLDNKCNVPVDADLIADLGLPAGTAVTPRHSQAWCQIFEPQTVNETTTWLQDTAPFADTPNNARAEAESTGTFAADPIRFPCPAPFMSIDNPNFGKEGFDETAINAFDGRDGTCTADIDGDGVDDGTLLVRNNGGERVFIGTLPVSTLGLGARAAIDPYGNLLTYAVSESVVSMGALDGGVRADGFIVIDDGLSLTGLKDGVNEFARFVLVSHGKSGNGAWSARGNSFKTCDTTREDSVNCPETQNNEVKFQSSNAWADSETLQYDQVVISQLAYGVDGWLRQTDTESSHLAAKNVGNVGFGTTPAPSARLHIDGNYQNSEGTIVVTGTPDVAGFNAYSAFMLSDDSDRTQPQNSGWSLLYNQDNNFHIVSRGDNALENDPRIAIVKNPVNGDVGINNSVPQATLHVSAVNHNGSRTGSVLIEGGGINNEYSNLILGGMGEDDTWKIVYKDDDAVPPETKDMQIKAVNAGNNSLWQGTHNKEVALSFDFETGNTGFGTVNPFFGDTDFGNNVSGVHIAGINRLGVLAISGDNAGDRHESYSTLMLAQGNGANETAGFSGNHWWGLSHRAGTCAGWQDDFDCDGFFTISRGISGNPNGINNESFVMTPEGNVGINAERPFWGDDDYRDAAIGLHVHGKTKEGTIAITSGGNNYSGDNFASLVFAGSYPDTSVGILNGSDINAWSIAMKKGQGLGGQCDSWSSSYECSNDLHFWRFDDKVISDEKAGAMFTLTKDGRYGFNTEFPFWNDDYYKNKAKGLHVHGHDRQGTIVVTSGGDNYSDETYASVILARSYGDVTTKIIDGPTHNAWAMALKKGEGTSKKCSGIECEGDLHFVRWGSDGMDRPRVAFKGKPSGGNKYFYEFGFGTIDPRAFFHINAYDYEGETRQASLMLSGNGDDWGNGEGGTHSAIYMSNGEADNFNKSWVTAHWTGGNGSDEAQERSNDLVTTRINGSGYGWGDKYAAIVFDWETGYAGFGQLFPKHAVDIWYDEPDNDAYGLNITNRAGDSVINLYSGASTKSRIGFGSAVSNSSLGYSHSDTRYEFETDTGGLVAVVEDNGDFYAPHYFYRVATAGTIPLTNPSDPDPTDPGTPDISANPLEPAPDDPDPATSCTCPQTAQNDMILQWQNSSNPAISCEGPINCTPGQTYDAGHVATISDNTGANTGSMQVECNSNGNWYERSSVCEGIVGANCPAGTIEWQGEYYDRDFLESSAPSGSGTGWSWSPSRCGASTCQISCWTNIQTAYPHDTHVEAYDLNPNDATATSADLYCNNGNWEIHNPVCDFLSNPVEQNFCEARTMNWTENGNECNGYIQNTSSGQTSIANDSSGITTGSATYYCNNGIWNFVGGNCNNTPSQPPAQPTGCSWAGQTYNLGPIGRFGTCPGFCSPTPANNCFSAHLRCTEQGVSFGQTIFSPWPGVEEHIYPCP